MITVTGSINLDIVATGPALPRPTNARLARHPGGKGANQALAARRLGADVRLIGAVGADDMAEEALKLLQVGGVDLSGVQHINGETTGVALIAVSADGENQIVVCPGANAALRPSDVAGQTITHMMGVLDLAPATTVPDALLDRASLLSVNETEAAFYGDKLHTTGALVAISLGDAGAALYRGGKEIAREAPPEVQVVDTVGAGDTFTAALTVALIEGMTERDALRFAVTAGALACTRPGAQPSLPQRADVDSLVRKTWP